MIDYARLTHNQSLLLVFAGVSSVFLDHSFVGFVFISSSMVFRPLISTMNEVNLPALFGPLGAFSWVLVLLSQSALGTEQLIQGIFLLTLSFYSFSSMDGFGNAPKLAFHASWTFSASSAILYSLLDGWEAATIIVLFIHLLFFPNLSSSIKWNYPVFFLSLALGIRYVEILLSSSQGGGLGNEIIHAHELWIMFLSSPIIGVAVFYLINEIFGNGVEG